MTLPSNPDARRFYRAAKQRFDDAQFLIRGERTTDANTCHTKVAVRDVDGVSAPLRIGKLLRFYTAEPLV